MTDDARADGETVGCRVRRLWGPSFGLFLLCVPLGEIGSDFLHGLVTPTKLAFYVFAALCVGAMGRTRFRFWRRGDIWLGGLLISAALSVAGSRMPGVSLRGALRVVGVVLLYLLARRTLACRSGVRIASLCLAAAGGVMALLGMYQTLSGRTVAGLGIYPFYGTLVPVYALDRETVLAVRASAAFSHPNQLGMFLVAAIAATLALAAPSARRPLRWAWLALAGWQMMAVIYTFARSAWLGLLMVVGVFAWRSRVRRGVVCTALCAVLVAVALLPASGRQAFLSRGGSRQPYDTRRLEYWQTAVRMAVDRPFTGIGLGTFNARFPDYCSPGTVSDGEQEDDAHNGILALLAEAGMMAGLALAFGLGRSFWLVMRGVGRGPALPDTRCLLPLAMLLGVLPPLLLNTYQYEEVLWIAMAWAGCLPERQTGDDDGGDGQEGG